MAENNEVIIPIPRVVAKPLIGPVPKKNKIPAVNKVVTFASIMAEYAFLYTSFISSFIPFPALNSSFIR